jgi:hypothetical protein
MIVIVRSPDAMQYEVLLRRAGAVSTAASVTVPALRCSVKDAAPRPGHNSFSALTFPSPAIG